jgi:hypothetical protein
VDIFASRANSIDENEARSSRAATDHAVIDLLGDGVPRLIILHMAMVGVVRPVADPPAVVGHQNRRVGYVTHQVVERAVVAEALVSAAGQDITASMHYSLEDHHQGTRVGEEIMLPEQIVERAVVAEALGVCCRPEDEGINCAQAPMK